MDQNTLIASRFYRQAVARSVLPSHRVGLCLRRMIPNRQRVEIWRNKEARKAHYRNLMCCGSVWVCPVCAAKISEHRKQDIAFILANAPNRDLSPILVTYTMRHSSRDTLQQTLNDLVDAYKAVTSGRAWQDIRERHGVFGYIRALEMTHGRNGWHPHLHVLTLVHGTPDHMATELRQRWIDKLAALGRSAIGSVGCDVRLSNDAIADYIAKWGRDPSDPAKTKSKYWSMEAEVAKASSKAAGGGNLNPFQLLDEIAVANILGLAPTVEKSLFEEYARVTKGRRQLEYSRSPSLIREFGVRDRSDEEIMDTHDSNAVLLASLDVEQWQCVLRVSAVGTLLRIAGEGDIKQLYDFLEEIGARVYK
jgi:hypothetical protein